MAPNPRSIVELPKPKESFETAACESKLRSVASHGLVCWTALIARPRPRPIGRFSSLYRAGVGALAVGG
jgi:hypothetical protein